MMIVNTMKSPAHPGEVVKALREQRDWSQSKLASVAGLHMNTVVNLEKTGKCSLDTARDISKALNVPLSSLVFDDPAHSPSVLPTSPAETKGKAGDSATSPPSADTAGSADSPA